MEILTLVFAAIAAPATLPPCELERRGEVAFSSRSARDSLKARIHGKQCYDSELQILIRTRGGELVYRYVAPFCTTGSALRIDRCSATRRDTS